MLTEIYIEALLVNEELADQVWEAWDKGEIDYFTTYFAWMLISVKNLDQSMQVRRKLSLRVGDGPPHAGFSEIFAIAINPTPPTDGADIHGPRAFIR